MSDGKITPPETQASWIEPLPPPVRRVGVVPIKPVSLFGMNTRGIAGDMKLCRKKGGSHAQEPKNKPKRRKKS